MRRCLLALRPGWPGFAWVASIRHQDTGYDALLMSGMPRDTARDHVRDAIDRVLTAWRDPRESRPTRS